MSNPASSQHEPTMEEILASIRKIISDDQPGAAKPAPEPIAVRSAPVQPEPQAEADILELTDEVEDEVEAMAEPMTQVQAPIENDIAFENIEPEPEAEPAMENDELISDSTRSAMGRAFAKLHEESPKPAARVAGGPLEALFTQAVEDAFTPTLQEWVDGHQADIMDQLKPVIRDWMDDHLPQLIEAAVTKEIGRAAARNARRR
jgi:hypothetical protein